MKCIMIALKELSLADHRIMAINKPEKEKVISVGLILICKIFIIRLSKFIVIKNAQLKK